MVVLCIASLRMAPVSQANGGAPPVPSIKPRNDRHWRETV